MTASKLRVRAARFKTTRVALLLTIDRTTRSILLSTIERSGVGNDARQDLLQGTLDLLVLKVLSVNGDMHGWGIAQAIQRTSRDALQVNQGSLYPSLHRLERRGLLHAEWGMSENNRSAKYYRLTPDGRRALAEQTADWERVAGAVRLILRMA